MALDETMIKKVLAIFGKLVMFVGPEPQRHLRSEAFEGTRDLKEVALAFSHPLWHPQWFNLTTVTFKELSWNSWPLFIVT